MTDIDRLRYPIGKFERLAAPLDERSRASHLKTIEDAPARFRALIDRLSDAQLDTPYRPGGWTVRQVVHHVPESHMNAYVRMKLALTEDTPAIKTYEEQLWAELPDAKTAPAELSLSLLEALHRRWVLFLSQMSEDQWARAFKHPQWGTMRIDEAVALYAWHCRHHLAHVEQALTTTVA